MQPDTTPLVQSQPVVNATVSQTQVPAGSPITPQPNQQRRVIYVGFWRRWLASFIDGLLIYFVSFVIGFIPGFISGFASGISGTPNTALASIKLVASIVSFVIGAAYYIYFIGSRGQTLGKMALKIKVVKEGTDFPPGYLSAFLREILGKLISFMVFGLGYLWMLRDPQKQTWHDKFAHTVVVKVS